MSNEATVNAALQIKKGSLDYMSRPASFRADVSTARGPTPGSVNVSTAGTDIDLSALTTPGLCRIMNVDATNYVQYGIYDPESGTFFPLGEILPGESYVIRLARDIQEQYGTGVGTGTTDAGLNRLRFKAIGGDCVILVEAFER